MQRNSGQIHTIQVQKHFYLLSDFLDFVIFASNKETYPTTSFRTIRHIHSIVTIIPTTILTTISTALLLTIVSAALLSTSLLSTTVRVIGGTALSGSIASLTTSTVST